MSDEIGVWDRFVRIFHWSAVVLVLTCLLTEDEQMSVHVYSGYVLMALLALRIAWGFAGPRSARFADFVHSPSVVIRDLRAIGQLKARRYLGHSPAGGAMVVVLLIVLVLIGITGIASYGAEEQAGPLGGLLANADMRTRDWLASLHEALANFLWLLIFGHLGGVALASYAHRENLVRAMFTGVKRAPPVEQATPSRQV